MFRDFESMFAVRSLGATTSEEIFKRACHKLMTAQCPSIPKLEQVARGRGTLTERVHKNLCPYCQRSIVVFRETLHLTPLPKRLFEAAQQAFSKIRERAVREVLLAGGNSKTVFAGGRIQGTRAEFRCADAVILLPDLTTQPAKVELRKLDFVERDLWMTLRLPEPIKDFTADSGFELLVMSDAEVFGPFTLPALATGQEEEIMLQLPPRLAQGWEQQLKLSPDLPFELILSVRDE